MKTRTIKTELLSFEETQDFLKNGFLISVRTQAENTYYPPHCHDYFELEIVADGTVLLNHNEQELTVSCGHAYLCTYSDIHAFHSLTDSTVINIRFQESVLESQLLSLLFTPLGSPLVFFDSDELAKITSFINRLLEEQETKPFCYTLMSKNIISGLMITILRKSALSENRQLPTPIQKAVSVVMNQFASDLSLRQVSAQINLSPDYFGKLFKKSTGLSFREYLNLVRIRHACKLLVNSDASVKEIAFSSGYRSVEYFMYSFKKINKKTPLGYKKTLKQQKNSRPL